MSKKRGIGALYGACVAVLACGIVFSFGLHSIQLTHAHPGHADQTDHHHGNVLNIDEYVHATEQKFFLILILLTLFGTGLLLFLASAKESHFGEHRRSARVRHLPMPALMANYLVLLFLKGILHGKPY